MRSAIPVPRLAVPDDAPGVGRMLHDFNVEYDEPTPDPAALGARVGRLLADGELTALLTGDGPDGLAVLRFRPALWSPGLECHLAELSIVPPLRGRGLGRVLLEAAMAHARERCADTIDLGTSEGDVAARGLYESAGFTNRESDGAIMYVYEREL